MELTQRLLFQVSNLVVPREKGQVAYFLGDHGAGLLQTPGS